MGESRRQILYLVTKGPAEFSDDRLLKEAARSSGVSVVLLQEGVMHQHFPVNQVYALSEDAASRNVSPPFPQISYADLLRMIFEADSVVAL